MAQTVQIKRSTVNSAPQTLANGELAYSHVGTTGKLYVGRPGGSSGDIDAIGGKYYIDRSEEAHGWGDHSTAGYLVADDADYNSTEWDAAYDYSQVGHLPLAGGALTGDTSVETGTNPTITIKNTDTTVVANQVIGTLEFIGTDDVTGGVLSGQIQQKAAQGSDWGVGYYGSNMSFSIRETGGGAFAEKLRLQTSGALVNDGLTVVGDMSVGGEVTENLTMASGKRLYLSDTGYLVSSGDSTQLVEEDAAGNLEIIGSNIQFRNVNAGTDVDFFAKFIEDGAVELYHDGTKKMETSSDGVIISGNLTVNGTTTTVNTENLYVSDNIISLNSDFSTGTPTENAGIAVRRGGFAEVSLRWNESDDDWEVTEDGTAYYKLLHANNWNAEYSGVVDGGSF